MPTEIWCLILRYLDDGDLLRAVQTNGSWLAHAKGDPALNKRLNSALLKKRKESLKMKCQVTVQRPFPLPWTFILNNQNIVIQKPDEYLKYQEIYDF
ncbi:unnamed protein product [Acanthoscelides obtectus]|uniref:F-box domain-containing protein n=1 Tax=Acanthoscelides obtectus TaxID=200917 RepID=A0A9P0K7I1_ACAOB|nr:unnamed protein product [Acanthoscelides obtectus]CAK1666865.1 hypothetical protein AOBTE_LOCUS25528 [Acanthoscelides obtectus]